MSIKDLSCFSVISTNVFHDIENNIIKKSYQTNVEIGMSTEQIKGLIDDYIKKLQVAGISIPRVKDSYLENKKIFYNTDYCGENIIESGININNFNDFHSKINKIAEILKIAVSNSLYLDPHPKNFVFNELNSIFYVDFYPPYSSYLKSMRLKIAKPDEYSLISENFDFASVTEMAAHKTDPNTVYAATRRGVKVTTDGGQTWEPGLVTAAEFLDVEVAMDGSVFASTANGIFYSVDGTAGSFTQMTSVGAAFGGGSGRIEIALSPTDANYIYAIYSNQGGLGRYKGIYRSTDKGESWELILPGWDGTTPPTYNIFNQQANYAMSIAVDPQNKDRVIIGGLDLWEFEYGVGVEPISYWAISEFASFYVHADHHEIIFDESNPGRIYFGHDGGVSRKERLAGTNVRAGARTRIPHRTHFKHGNQNICMSICRRLTCSKKHL